MKRRKFFETSFGLGSGLLLLPTTHVLSACNNRNAVRNESRVVIARDQNLLGKEGTPDRDRILKLLDRAMQRYFEVDDPIEAWKSLFRPGETVGLKVNCLSGLGSTHPGLVEALTERLQESGIRQIIIWDRFDSDLEDAGFQIRYEAKPVRCFGNDAVGFEANFQTFGEAASLVTKTLTRLCDSVINLPLLRDHGIAGMTMALKNMFGAIHNPHKFHLNIGDPYIADVNMYPSIRKKVKLHIADAFWAQYEGGPSFMPQWRWPYSGIMVSRDPVAMDATGWQIIEQKRAEKGLKSLKEAGREPTYIATAADTRHRLGTHNTAEIERIEI